MNTVEVTTYRFANKETITGIRHEGLPYYSDGDPTGLYTEYVTPVQFHLDDKGIPAYVTIDTDSYPTIQIFMAHVMGKASQGEYELRTCGGESINAGDKAPDM